MHYNANSLNNDNCCWCEYSYRFVGRLHQLIAKPTHTFSSSGKLQPRQFWINLWLLCFIFLGSCCVLSIRMLSRNLSVSLHGSLMSIMLISHIFYCLSMLCINWVIISVSLFCFELDIVLIWLVMSKNHVYFSISLSLFPSLSISISTSISISVFIYYTIYEFNAKLSPNFNVVCVYLHLFKFLLICTYSMISIFMLWCSCIF